jgi:hypothetical protein
VLVDFLPSRWTLQGSTATAKTGKSPSGGVALVPYDFDVFFFYGFLVDSSRVSFRVSES